MSATVFRWMLQNVAAQQKEREERQHTVEQKFAAEGEVYRPSALAIVTDMLWMLFRR
jgi:hypothetical protein